MADSFSLGRHGKYGEIDFSKLKSGITKKDLGIEEGSVLSNIFDSINTNLGGNSETKLDREELNAFIEIIRDLAGNQRLSTREAKKYEIDNLTKKEKKQLIDFLQKLSKLTLNVKNLQIQDNEQKSELITFDDGHTEEIFPDGSKIITVFDGGKTTTTKKDKNGKITEEIAKEGDSEVKTEYTNSGKKVTTTTPDATEIVQYDTNDSPIAKKTTDNTTGIIEKFVFENGKPILKIKTDPQNNQEITYDGTKETIVTNKDGVKTTVVKDNGAVIQQKEVKTNKNNQVETKDIAYDGDNLTENFYVDDVQKYQRKVVDGKEYRVNYDENGNTTGVVVQYGETPSAIAKKFGCTLEELAEANKGDGEIAHFAPGEEIVIPGKLDADAKALQGRKSKEEVKAQVKKIEEQRRKAEVEKRKKAAAAKFEKSIRVKGANGYFVRIDDDGELHYYNPKKQEITPNEFKKSCPSIYENVNGIKTVVRNKYNIKTMRNDAKQLSKKIKSQISGASLNKNSVGYLNSVTPENVAFVVEQYKRSTGNHIAKDIDDEWGLDIETVKKHICWNLCKQAQNLGIKGVYFGDYQKIDNISDLEKWIDKAATKVIQGMYSAKETIKIAPGDVAPLSEGEKSIYKQKGQQVVDKLKKAISGSNDDDKIKAALDQIDHPETFKEVERLLVLEGYTIDNMYSPLEKFMREELQATGMDYTCEDLETYVQKWIANGVIKGDEAIDAQARLAARVIIEAGDGFGTDYEETKKGIALIKAPTGQGKDAAKKVYDKINKIIAGHGTFYGIGTKSDGLINYLDGEVWDGEIKYLKGILAETDALQGVEKTEAVRDLAEEASAGMGTDEEYLRQAIKGIRSREDRIAVEAKIKEYCLKKGIKPQIEGQSYIQVLLYDESNFKEIRQYNEMLIEQGVYNEQEIINLRAELATLQMLNLSTSDIREAVKNIKDPRVLAKVDELLQTKDHGSLQAFLDKNFSQAGKDLINAELASNNLLDNNQAVDVAFRLLQNSDFDKRAMGFRAIRNEAVANAVDAKLKEKGLSLGQLFKQFNIEKEGYKNKSNTWDNLAFIPFLGDLAEHVSENFAENTDVSSNFYVEIDTPVQLNEHQKQAYETARQDLETRLAELERAYQEVLDGQGVVSAAVNVICERYNIGTTRDEINTRIKHDKETLRLLNLAAQGKLGKIVDGKTVSVSFEEVFKERQSVKFSGNITVAETNPTKATEFDATKTTEVATHQEKVGALYSIKEIIVNSWNLLEDGLETKDAKKLAVAIYDTLKKLSSISGQEMSLEQLGYSLNSQGVIVDEQGKPVSVDKLVEIAKQLKKGLADVANNSFGTKLTDTTSASSVKSILENSYQKEVDSFKETYKEAWGQYPPDELLNDYISTIQNGMMVINFGVAIGAALLAPFTGGGSLVAFLGVTGSAASAIAVGVNVGVATMALNTLEHSTDADGLTSSEFLDDSEQAFWAAITSAVGARIGMYSDAKVAQVLPKYRAIAAKWSLANLEQVEKAAVIMARLEALAIEFSSDAVQSVVEMFAREGKLDGPAFRNALIMSLVGNAAGHAMSARGDLKADADAPARPSVDDVVHDYNAPGPRAEVRTRQAEIQAQENFVEIGKKRIDIATATEAELIEARNEILKWSDSTRNKQELLDLIDDRLNNPKPVTVGNRSAEVVGLLNQSTAEQAAQILSKNGHVTPEEFALLETHLVNNLKTPEQVEEFIQQIRNRVGVNDKGNMHVYQVEGKDYGAMIINKAIAQKNKIKANLADFNNVQEILNNVITNNKGLNAQEMASIKAFVEKAGSVEELQTILEQLNKVKKSDATRALKKHIEKQIELRKTPANVDVNEPIVRADDNSDNSGIITDDQFIDLPDGRKIYAEIDPNNPNSVTIITKDSNGTITAEWKNVNELSELGLEVGLDGKIKPHNGQDPNAGVHSAADGDDVNAGARAEDPKVEQSGANDSSAENVESSSRASRREKIKAEANRIKEVYGKKIARAYRAVLEGIDSMKTIADFDKISTRIKKKFADYAELKNDLVTRLKAKAQELKLKISEAPSAIKGVFNISKEKVDALLEMLPTKQLKQATNLVIEKIKSLKTLADYNALKTKVNTMYAKYSDVKTQLLKWLDEKLESLHLRRPSQADDVNVNEEPVLIEHSLENPEKAMRGNSLTGTSQAGSRVEASEPRPSRTDIGSGLENNEPSSMNTQLGWYAGKSKEEIRHKMGLASTSHSQCGFGRIYARGEVMPKDIFEIDIPQRNLSEYYPQKGANKQGITVIDPGKKIQLTVGDGGREGRTKIVLEGYVAPKVCEQLVEYLNRHDFYVKRVPTFEEGEAIADLVATFLENPEKAMQGISTPVNDGI